MKKLAFAAFAATLLSLPLCAQTPTFKWDVPFEFVVETTTLPAGTYTASVPAMLHPVQLTGNDRHSLFFVGVRADPSDFSAAPTLLFHRYGDQYFLSEIRTSERSRAFPPSRVERELQKTLSAAGRKPAEILLAAR